MGLRNQMPESQKLSHKLARRLNACDNIAQGIALGVRRPIGVP